MGPEKSCFLNEDAFCVEPGEAPGKLSCKVFLRMSSVKGPGVPGAAIELDRLRMEGDDLDLRFIKGCLDEEKLGEPLTHR